MEQCQVCGSQDLYKYDVNGYRCNFCNYNNLYDKQEHTYSKEDIFNKNINVSLKLKKDKYRYLVLNGKSLKKYNQNELETMRDEYKKIVSKKDEFIQGFISYEDFIDYIDNNCNQFGVKFYNVQQSEIANSINERKKIISRLSSNPYDSDIYLTISVDMVRSSSSLSELEENIGDVSELFQFLNKQFLRCLKSAFYKRLTGDGFIALYKREDILRFIQLILEIEKIEETIITYIRDKKLNINNNYIRFGIGIDISRVIVMYGIEDTQTGQAINRSTKLSKIHIRERYSKGTAITTQRFVKYIQDWINISDKKEDKYDNAEVFYIEKLDLLELCKLLRK
jgi:hypothetical protein